MTGHRLVRGTRPRRETSRVTSPSSLLGTRWVASVCTGAMLLAAAGLTKGRPATTHQVALQELRESGADVREGVRYVDDGNLLTSAGVTAGLDLAFWIVERELGADLAMSIEREMAYVRTRQDSD